jgi:hypothetical protein
MQTVCRSCPQAGGVFEQTLNRSSILEPDNLSHSGSYGRMSKRMKLQESRSTSFAGFWVTPEIPVLICLWIAVFLIAGTPYPYHYDSVNYALAIIDRFDITIDQPHAPGYLFHVLFGRLVHLPVKNASIVQQLQNLVYLILILPCWYLAKQRRTFDILFLGTFPLILFFPAIPIVHTVSLTIGAWMAYALYKMEAREWSPLPAGIIYAVGIGFRQDTLIMMGPVFLYFLFRGHYPFRIWLQLVAIGALVSLSWYIPTRMASWGVDPFKATNTMNVKFYYASSVLLGAPLRENLRCALRFCIYGFGVIGPGGLLLLWYILRTTRPREWLPVLLALLPVLLYGTVFLLSFSYYYASVLGFFGTWALLKNGFPQKRRYLMLVAALLNIAFFWFVPRPHYEPWKGNFTTRTPVGNIVKQAGYIGANGRKQAVHTRDIITFADTTVGKAASVYIEPGLLWPRIWNYMAKYHWHNRMVKSADHAEMILGPFSISRPGLIVRSGNLAVYRNVKKTANKH